MNKIIIENFESWAITIPKILDQCNLAEKIAGQQQILLKPNLTINLPPPVSTPVEFVEEVVKFILKNSKAKIVIAEGAGGCDTQKCFSDLGYEKLAEKYPIELIDLNLAQRIKKENPNAIKLKKVYLPQISFESFIINLPVLKIHSEAKMTAALKNVFGFYLNSNWLMKKVGGLFGRSGEGWLATRSSALRRSEVWWNKSELHFSGVNNSIKDLNNYIKFDFNLVDASIGQLESEVHGLPCSPPIGKIIAGFDAKKVDIACAPLLNLDPKEIKYLNNLI